MPFQNSLTLFLVICFTLSYTFGPIVGPKITNPCLGNAVHSKTNHKIIQFLAKTPKKHNVLHPMLTSLLPMMHDVEANPGPTKFPCGTCEMAVRSNHQAICCDRCSRWFHIARQGMCPKPITACQVKNSHGLEHMHTKCLQLLLLSINHWRVANPEQSLTTWITPIPLHSPKGKTSCKHNAAIATPQC